MNRTSTKIISIYLVAGILWILISDSLFEKIGYPEERLYQTIKGCLFIVVSGIVFLVMLRRYENRNKRYLKKLRHSNLELEKRAAELAASNSELEHFAYIASHDLQEPLRMVTGFLSQIEKKYESVLDEKGRQYIHFAVDGAGRMRQTILDLLEYSRIGQPDFKREEFPVSEIVDEIIALNKTVVTENNALIIKNDLPVISGDRTFVRQLFQNLMLNALKYRKKSESPLITIGCTDTGSHWQFYVQDNGIGIRKDQLDRIFILFQRLHSREEFSGSGIGLAICKKIVENHGGRIWVTSEDGAGSTFYFSIKK